MTALEKLLAGTGPDAHPAPAGCIDAPELGDGERVHIRRLSIADSIRFDSTRAAGPGHLDRLAELLPLCLCDATGRPLLPTDRPLTEQQAAAVRAMPMSLALRVVEAAARLSAPDGAEAKKS